MNRIPRAINFTLSLEEITANLNRNAGYIISESSHLTVANEGLVANVKKFFSAFITHGRNLLEHPLTEHLIVNDITPKELKPYDFYSLSTVLVPVPKGLVVKWLDYIKQLEKADLLAQRIVPDMLKPLSEYVGILINQPGRMMERSLMPDITPIDHSPIEKELAKSLSGERTQRELAKCISRNNDWDSVNSKLIELCTNNTGSQLKDMINRMEVLDEQLEAVFNNIQTIGTDKVSSETIKVLASTSQKVADVLTFYTNFKSQLIALVQTYNAAKETIKQYGNE